MKTLLSLVLLLACGAALSQEPAPRPAKAGEPKKAEAKQRKQEAKGQQHGTEGSPLFVEGNVTTTKSKADADRDAQDGQEKSTSDRWLVIFTGIAAIAAAVAVVIGGIQAVFFWRQLLLMSRR
jgi:hypothetical protein